MITLKNVTSQPVEGKGSLLADDVSYWVYSHLVILIRLQMGLGKTITCVALIASTFQSAREFATIPLPPLPKPPLQQRSSEPLPSAADFEGSVWGMPDVSDFSHLSAKKKAQMQREKEKWECLYARSKRLKVRSRATLIVCPLSTVANWEDQFVEHWAGKVSVVGGSGSSCASQTTLSQFIVGPSRPAAATQAVKQQTSQESTDTPDGTPPPPTANGVDKKSEPLKVYVYHGNARRPDPKYLADFDAVITTYATLASEFSKQGKSIATQEGEDDDDDVDSNDTPEMDVDVAGNQIIQIPQAKKGRKRKKSSGLFTGASEISSPLQSVIWFRIVLDEAQ
jgi:SNF2 family DNA or RNA helicase